MKTLSFFFMLLLSAGCTSVQLRSSTLAQSRGVTDIYYQMVLDNLARAKYAPGRLPWHTVIQNGNATINDTLTPNFSYVWSPVSRTLGITGSRSWQETWNIVPLHSEDALNALKRAYDVAASDSWVKESRKGLCGEVFSGRYGGKSVYVAAADIDSLNRLVLTVIHIEDEAAKSGGALTHQFFGPGPYPQTGKP